MPHNLGIDLCETSFKLLNYMYWNLKILTDIKIKFKKKQTFIVTGQVVFAPLTQT
jgi:hypothetical protein